MTIKQNKMYGSAVAVFLGILLAVQAGCNNSTGPDDFLANIIASNDCGIAVDIFLDNELQFSLENQESKAIEKVSQGIHVLLAKKKSDGIEVFSDMIDVSRSGNYNWIIESPADVKLVNSYGDLLSVYADGSLLGDLEDQTSQVIQNIPYGKHRFDAVRKSDNTLVKSTEIDIQENKEYTWTIIP